jgi:dihydroorotate dehydrogenase electron transfer subunit
MNGPLHAAHYADQAVQRTAEIVENVKLARDTFRVRFVAPEIARRIIPGQFLMLRLAGMNDPLIGRPLALYDTVLSAAGRPEAVDVVYLTKGKLTSRLCDAKPGQLLDVWGPLGNGFKVQSSKFKVGTRQETTLNLEPGILNPSLIMVAGGIGQTPFLALAKDSLGLKQFGESPRNVSRASRVTFCYGARTAEYFAGLEDFERLGIDLRLATDDGSRGQHGFVTDLLRQVLEEQPQNPLIVCCGPEPMMEAVAKISAQFEVPCQVSLETPMACGIGICFTCVAKIHQPEGGWDYKRTCVEGPVFDAGLVEW